MMSGLTVAEVAAKLRVSEEDVVVLVFAQRLTALSCGDRGGAG